MATIQPGDREDMRRAAVNAIHEHWVLFLIEGIVLVILGIAAIIVPVVATLVFTLFIGWLFPPEHRREKRSCGVVPEC